MTNNADSGSGSLRYAIAAAAAGDTVTFDPIVFARPQVITLTTGPISLGKTLIIQGPSENLVAIDGNNTSEVFYIGGGITLTISGVTIQHGSTGWVGGAVFNDGGNVSITDSQLIHNSAGGAGRSFHKGRVP